MRQLRETDREMRISADTTFKLSWMIRLLITWFIILSIFVVLTLKFLLNYKAEAIVTVVSALASVTALVFIVISIEIALLSSIDHDKPTMSGVASKSAQLLLDFYKEPSLQVSLGTHNNKNSVRVPQSILHSFDKGLNPDRVKIVKSAQSFVLDSQLLRLSLEVEAYYRTRRDLVFHAADKVGIVQHIVPKNTGKNALIMSFAKGSMIHEYSTVQNPDEDYRHCPNEHSPDVICENSVRFLASPDGKFPRLDTSKAAYRMGTHIVLQLSDGRFILQERPYTKVATSPGEITSSMGSSIDWTDIASRVARLKSHFCRRSLFTNYVLREIKEELQIVAHEIRLMKVVALVRDFQRLGLPVVILLGKTDLTLSEILRRWNRQRSLYENPWLYPYWSLINKARGNLGREYWESQSILVYSIDDIPELLKDPLVQPSTKTCLYYLWREQVEWDPTQMFDEDYYNNGDDKGLSNYSLLSVASSEDVERIVTNFIKTYRPGKVLDVGCSFGHYVSEFRRHDIEAYGVDASEISTRRSRQEVKSYIANVNAVRDKLPFEDCFFDFIICLETIEHIPLYQLEKFMTEVLRVLKPGGIVVFSTPNPTISTKWRNDITHINVHNYSTWLSIMSLYGQLKKIPSPLDRKPIAKLIMHTPDSVLRISNYVFGDKYHRLWMQLRKPQTYEATAIKTRSHQ